MISLSERVLRRYSWCSGTARKSTIRALRIVIFHAFLLRGTGSNIYNASLARALTRMGHEVHLFCQDREAAQLEFVDAVGTWEGGELRGDGSGGDGRCTAYLPDIGEILPVYVADEYEGFRAVRLPE